MVMPRRGAALAWVGLSLLVPALPGCGGDGARAGPEQRSAVAAAAEPRRIDPPAAPGSLAPNLALAGGAPLLSWLEPLEGNRHRLLVSRLEGGSWSAPAVVAEGGGFFANWADLPAVGESGDGSLVAHWLAKTGEDTYAYSIFLARSVDGGAIWTPLGRLDDDDTETEHGFVSYVPEGDGLRAFWLDGREMAGGGDMGLRTALIDGEAVGASELLDDRTCECCSTDAALGSAGPLVVYRDRSGDEVRDVSVVRGGAAGWTAPTAVAADGWNIAGCPVNGPAVAADGESAAVAWYTAAGEAPRVQLALSADGGRAFGPAVPIDVDGPAGRVDVVLDGAGGAVVSWLGVERDVGSVRLRRVSPGGSMGEPLEVAVTGASRASGFPRLALSGDTLYLAWVDTTPEGGQLLRARAMTLDQVPGPPPGR